jgi:hypothetical protein
MKNIRKENTFKRPQEQNPKEKQQQKTHEKSK